VFEQLTQGSRLKVVSNLPVIHSIRLAGTVG